MSEIGVITWNVRGDSEDGAGAKCVDCLMKILNQLKSDGKRVDLLCFQETSGPNSAIKSKLKSLNYACEIIQEQEDGGDWYLFALHPDSGYSFAGEPEPCLFDYDFPTSGPVRYPARVELDRSGSGKKTALYTFHAPLYGMQYQGLEECSACAEADVEDEEIDCVFVTGDLNVTADDYRYDAAISRNRKFLQKMVFPSFAGGSNRLDHIFRWPAVENRKIEVKSFGKTTSDHDLFYVKFQVK